MNRRTEMLLEDKNAVIYGGGGKVGGVVARAFAREGARLFLAGRTLESLEEVADDIRSSGGVVETAQVGALDEQAVDMSTPTPWPRRPEASTSRSTSSPTGTSREHRSPRCHSKTSSGR